MKSPPTIIRLTFAMTLALSMTKCTDENNVIDGGNSTAAAKVEAYLAGVKMVICTPEWFATPTIPTDSFPVADGVQAAILTNQEMARYETLLATTCDEVFIALNDQEAPAECDEVGVTCDGDTVIKCVPTNNGSNIALKTDCSAMDLVCLNGQCVAARCSTTSCDYDTLLACAEGIATSTDCSSLGLICGRGTKALECIGAGDTCAETDVVPSCVGTVLTGCLAGRMAQVDCSALTDGRRQCSQAWIDANIDSEYLTIPGDLMFDTALDQSCSPAGTECEAPATACDDDFLAICIDGYWEYIDCLAYGFTGCSGTGGSASCTGFPVAP